jgi:hypothetical protein
MLAWSSSFCAKNMDQKKQIPNTWRYSIRNALYFTAPAQTLLFTTSETSLLLFYQFQNASFETIFDMLSVIFAAIFSIYMIGFYIYLGHQLNRKTKSYINDEDYKRRFNFYLKYLDDSMYSKNFPIVLIIRKILFSAILVYIYKDPLVQISLTVMIYCMFWTYLIAVRPFRQNRYNIFTGIV